MARGEVRLKPRVAYQQQSEAEVWEFLRFHRSGQGTLSHFRDPVTLKQAVQALQAS